MWTRETGPCFLACARNSGSAIEWSPPSVMSVVPVLMISLRDDQLARVQAIMDEADGERDGTDLYSIDGYNDGNSDLYVMPVTGGLPHRWYNTPNIHLCTLKDFELLAVQVGLREQQLPFVDQQTRIDRLAVHRVEAQLDVLRIALRAAIGEGDADDVLALGLVAQEMAIGQHAVDVLKVQTGSGLVENVKHAHQACANLRGKPDPLRLATAERAALAIQR